MQQVIRLPWLIGALQGFAALALSALLLWTLLPALYPSGVPVASKVELTLPGRDFAAVVAARAGVEGDSMLVQAMQPAQRGGRQIGEAVWQMQLQGLAADDFAQLRLNLEGVQPGQTVMLFWRSAERSEGMHFAELEYPMDGVSWQNLWRIESWQGELLELAVGVFGLRGPEPLRLQQLSLHGINRASTVQRGLAEWQRFHPWRQSSANRYPGVHGDTLIQPAAAAGLWAGLALLLVAGWQVWRREPRGTLAVAGLWVLLLPWLALDYLWQQQLQRQLQDTRAQFGALSHADKALRDIDPKLQRYAAHLQQLLQPLRHQRLFLLHDADKGHHFARLRLQYRLLPLNVYNFGRRLVPAEYLRPGDLVLLLHPVTEVRYDPLHGLLEDGRQQVAATLIDSDPLGELYRIAERPR
ncbi:MAG: hypothetical protein ACNA7T_14140 [Haliea sp.]